MSDIPDLVEQVAGLTDATTELLDATNVAKQTLDEAVDSATGSAQSAQTDSETATEARNESVQARNESVSARDDAEAIVHQGEGSTTPGGGKYPVAYDDGQIDSGWIPLIQAMYPYSGVIGNLAKTKLIEFNTSDSSWANRIRILARSQNIYFNIAGRFVDIPNQYVNLDEAESTADRAIAFDDIFLDWTGNLTPYRSITPHRTTTGYDADAIAYEHGYSKISTGLYKTGDTYALLLGRVSRRNQGAYHPLWNPEGSRRVNSPSLGFSSGSNWHVSSLYLTSKIDAFNIIDAQNDDSTPGAARSSGYIGSHVGNQPQERAYDAIYSDDFTPLYYSAQNVIDRQALLFDSFNKAVAGETFMGAEGTGTASKYNSRIDNSSSNIYTGYGSYLVSEGLLADDYVLIRFDQDTDGILRSNLELNTFYKARVNWRGGTHEPHQSDLINPLSNDSRWFVGGDSTTTNIRVTIHVFRKSAELPKSARPQFLVVDIIGSLDAMPQEWIDNGLPGNWIAVGEEGEDLIPDGTSKNFKMSRKVMDAYLVLKTQDRGATWSDLTTQYQSSIEGESNAFTEELEADACVMVFYLATANPFELSTNASILAISQGYRFNENQVWRGNLASERMIGKISTSSHTHIRYPIEYDNGSYLTKLNNPTHSPLSPSASSSPAVKILPYLGSTETVFTLNAAYKEQKYSNGSWGDDNQFNIVDYQSTVTDLNGETVIVGQKFLKTQYQYDGVIF